MTHDRAWVRRLGARDRREVLVDSSVEIVPVMVPQRASPDEPPEIGITQSQVAQRRAPLWIPRNHEQPCADVVPQPIHPTTLPPHPHLRTPPTPACGYPL